ncbi:MAG: hypothetical protein KME28_24970 [Pelatocladus maniniholoensis HA4357-MV3]|jgi:ABC-type enterochelin transport system substrate-binding protein|uniref:Uncharacterized protein n=1 Tax=Pelatocladus maniniholoensis HA4357-MV3 TaxID=1117104 RepID=A0A9E3LV75_9NOST|nr:hypothetical protein [Pelatocladus maniniholoensis HA4357-MV3]BAZ70178.1 hypothetical protein NIES4106_49650 [Fischerella sp. NIES-4106]
MHNSLNKLLAYMLIATLVGCATQQSQQLQQTDIEQSSSSGGQQQCSRIEVRQDNGKTEVKRSNDC